MEFHRTAMQAYFCMGFVPWTLSDGPGNQTEVDGPTAHSLHHATPLSSTHTGVCCRAQGDQLAVFEGSVVLLPPHLRPSTPPLHSLASSRESAAPYPLGPSSSGSPAVAAGAGVCPSSTTTQQCWQSLRIQPQAGPSGRPPPPEESAGAPWGARRPRVRVPPACHLHFLQGECDDVVPLEQTRALAAALRARRRGALGTGGAAGGTGYDSGGARGLHGTGVTGRRRGGAGEGGGERGEREGEAGVVLEEVPGGVHRLSRPRDLERLRAALARVLEHGSGPTTS